MKPIAVFAAVALAIPAWGQETTLEAQFRAERQDFNTNCVDFHAAGCGQLLFTADPLHIAVGSLAPLNGFGSGIAFVTHYTPNEDWRLFWNVDAIATPNGSWRAGGYMTAVLIRHRKIVVRTGTTSQSPSHLAVQEMPVFHVYAQTESLNKIAYYGLGQGTPRTEYLFGMTETIAGADVVWPVFSRLNISLLGEANGRFVSLRASSDSSLLPTAFAPGFSGQPDYAQFGQGVRLRPTFANGYVRLNYTAKFEEWVAGASGYSFRRFSADLDHQFPLYGTTRALLPHDFNGPDSCSSAPDSTSCPSISRNLEGSFGFRFLYTASYTSGDSVVPLDLDPTLGGSDINGTTLLPSYADYRFRGPDLMLLRGTFEHSIGKLPIGAKFLFDVGRVALNTGDLGFSHAAHSYAAGLTLHAGGLPVVDLLFAWGGGEGTHTIANVSNSLLGGTSRPSLF